MLQVKSENVPVIIVYTGLLLLEPVNISGFHIKSWPQDHDNTGEEAVLVKEIMDNIFPNIHHQLVTDPEYLLLMLHVLLSEGNNT